MTDFTALALAQVQFLGGLGFHQAFLALAVALAWLLCGMKWRARQAAAWMPAYRFWVRFFALAWVLAFASGLPVLFQAGSLWPGLGERVGNVAGPLLAAIVLTVFLFKTCFLGVMLFGQMRVSARVHALSVFMTAMGLTLTLFWELALLAWTHAPVGSTWFNGQYYVDDWRTLLFDGLAPWMMLRVLAGGFFAVACLMTGISAWQSLRRELSESETRVCRLGIWMALASLLAWGAALLAQVPLLAAWQPVQLAALAGLWESGSESAFLLFAWPDPAAQVNLAEWRLGVAGWPWLAQQDEGAWVGLDQASGMLPPVSAVFLVARVLGLLMLVVVLALMLALWMAQRRGWQRMSAWPVGLRRVLAWLTLAGLLMLLLSLWLGEMGRLPYFVHGTITFAEVGNNLPVAGLVASLAAYVLVLGLGVWGFARMLFQAARHGVVPVRRAGETLR